MELDTKKAKEIISSGVDAGLTKYIGRFCLILLSFYVVIVLIEGCVNNSDYNRDSTDGEERSGMRIHTDNLTNCQYLSTNTGGLTPRMTSLNKHMGCR